MRAINAYAIISIVEKNVYDFNIVNCATALQRLAKVFGDTVEKDYSTILKPLFSHIAQLLVQSPQDVQPRQVSGILWASGKLGCTSSQMGAALSKAGVKLLSRFKAQEISTAVWGMAKNSMSQCTLLSPLLRAGW
jgi:hypothetical protein